MIILASVEKCYNKQRKRNVELKKEVDFIFKRITLENNWHYQSRLKEPESYALKLESGKNIDPDMMEDFFACMFVVSTYDDIKLAINKIKDHVDVKYRRPEHDRFTSQPPTSFPYDSLRLFVMLKPHENLPDNHPPNNLLNILFEIQIKTFLQHAWDIAAHNLIYKGEEISWPSMRVMYEVKAILEHVEASILQINGIKDAKILAKSDKKTAYLNKIKKFIERNWSEDYLPKDKNKLCKNIYFLLQNSRTTLGELQRMLNEELAIKRGLNLPTLPPYFIIIQAIINKKPEILHRLINSSDTEKFVVPSEVQIEGIELSSDKVIRLE